VVGGEGKAVRDSLPPSGFLFHSERSDGRGSSSPASLSSSLAEWKILTQRRPLLPHEGRHKAMLYNTSLRTLPSRLGLVLAPRPFFLSFLAVVLVVRSQQAGLERSGPDVINPGPAV
jgi:hypothetical protein